eukprot:6199010-Amphidinium_carterae.2
MLSGMPFQVALRRAPSQVFWLQCTILDSFLGIKLVHETFQRLGARPVDSTRFMRAQERAMSPGPGAVFLRTLAHSRCKDWAVKGAKVSSGACVQAFAQP